MKAQFEVAVSIAWQVAASDWISVCSVELVEMAKREAYPVTLMPEVSIIIYSQWHF